VSLRDPLGEGLPELDLPAAGVRSVGVIAALATVGLAVLSASATSPMAPGLVAAAFFLAVSIALLVPPETQLPIPATVLGAVTPTLLVLTAAPAARGTLHSTWYLGAGAFLLMLLALRHRVLTAWVGMVAAGVTAIAIPLSSQRIAAGTLELVLRQAALLAVVTIFALSIRGGQRRLERLDRMGLRAARRAAALQATSRERGERLGWAQLIATPLLREIAEGAELTPERRLEAELVEAELRDGLRARRLAVHPVTTAAREARARGVEVVLLDDRGEIDPDPVEVEEIRARVAAELDAARSGRVVARLLPVGRDEVATIVATP